jgi:glycosyltransferase involved in cell wall biosynthesis
MVSLHIDTAETWRGGQNQVLLTVLGLRAAGHRAILVAHPAGELARRASEGHDLVRLAPRNEVDLTNAWRLSRVIRQFAPDVVHAHDSHAVAVAALARSLGARVPRPPLVASRRVDFHIRGNSFSRWKYGQVDCFITASDAIHHMLVADGVPPEKIVTVHEGVDIERIAAAEPANLHKELWLPTHAPIVGTIAALVAHKGQRYLIDAVPLVLRDVPDARFVILGEGELRPALERQVAEARLEKHVFLPGFRADVLAALRAFDIFVMPSVTEGLGTSLLDAMAASKPVVATRAGGIPEVVADGETGFVVEPRDSRALADRIVRLLDDDALRARMGAAGLARVRARFSVERMVAATLDVYARLAGTRPAGDTVRHAARV